MLPLTFSQCSGEMCQSIYELNLGKSQRFVESSALWVDICTFVIYIFFYYSCTIYAGISQIFLKKRDRRATKFSKNAKIDIWNIPKSIVMKIQCLDTINYYRVWQLVFFNLFISNERSNFELIQRKERRCLTFTPLNLLSPLVKCFTWQIILHSTHFMLVRFKHLWYKLYSMKKIEYESF